MGLFVNRPEFNDELPGLPGEPLRQETAAERLPDAVPADLGLGAILGDGAGGAVESIVIPVAPIIEIAESQGPGEDA